MLELFRDGRISAADFVPQYRQLFAPFDPLGGPGESGLTEGEYGQLLVFVELMGGWFRESDHLIPKRADWRYGVDTKPYSWIDESGYRAWVGQRLKDLES
jgi:hypothetical protein